MGRVPPSTTNNLSRHFGVRRFYFADGLTKPPSESSLTRCYLIWKDIKFRDNGDGAEMFKREHFCSRLNICAPKPHLRWVPRSAPSPFVPIRSCFGHVNEQHDKACLSTMFLFRRRNYAPLSQTCTVGEFFRRRNYAPLSQTCTVGEFSPTLASRGALSECRATP